MSLFDSLGSFADSVGGWIGDVAHDAIGVTQNISQLESSLNAVGKPATGPKPAPAALVTKAAIGPPAPGMSGDQTVLLIALLGLGAYLIWRR
jgi:hypothetical protein